MSAPYPKIKVLPASSKNNVISGFKAAVTVDEYYNKFIYFGSKSDLTTHARGASVGSSGPPQSPPGNFKEVFWFGKFNSTTSPYGVDEKPTSETNNKILQVGRNAKMWRDDVKVYFGSLIFKNLDIPDEYRFIAFTTLNQIRLQGNPKVEPEANASSPVATPPGSPEGKYPSSSNISMTNAIGNKIVRIRLGDFPLYVAVASKIFLDLEERIKHYNIKFDRPFVPSYYIGLLRQVNKQLRAILTGNNVQIDNKSFIEFEFKSDFKTLAKLFSIKAPPAGTVWQPNNKNAYTELQHASGFSNQTLNSIIGSLGALYNKYNTTTQSRTPMATFRSEDQVSTFINSYIVPAPSLTTSDLTTNLLEKFILGDTQLLDDEYFNSYMTNPPQMAVGFKKNLNDEIAKQYESIGDFLGLQWVQGKFSEIRDPNDVYDKLLDHISIPDLVKLAAKCLLKLVPLDELLDLMCDWMLQRDEDGNTWFSKHLDGIVQELESMDDGVAKDLAKELSQVYFQLLDSAIEESIEVGGNTLEVGVAWLAELLADATDIGIWNNIEESKLTITKIRSSFLSVISALTNGERSFLAQRSSLQGRIKEVKAAKAQLGSQLTAFQGNVPPSHQSTMDYYDQKLHGGGPGAEGGKSLLQKENKINKAIKNATDQLRLYNFLGPINISSIDLTGPPHTQKEIFFNEVMDVMRNDVKATNFHYIMPSLLVLNPYTKENEKKAIFKNVLKMTAPSPKQAIKYLNDFNNFIQNTSFNVTVNNKVTTTWGDGFIFNDNYLSLANDEKDEIFKLNLSNLKKILQHIQDLVNLPSAPADVWNSLVNFGANTMNDYFDALFQDQVQRNRLCLAILGAVPGVGYLIYQLVDDPSQVGDWFVDQGSALYDGFSKRIEMFTKTDYPINDILKELGDSLIQVGLNLASDILIFGILRTLDELRKACEDAEVINAPYNPMGAVDLSGFITNSRTGPNNSTKKIEDSDSFKKVVSATPDITVSQFSTILSALSAAFNINEMCSILNNRASSKSYSKAISVMNSFNFLKNTKFHDLYVNDLGIREFFKSISKDIEPAFCAQAINNYEREKSLLLKICFGKDDSVLEQVLCKDLPPAECLKLLSARSELPAGLVNTLFGQVNNLFQPQTPLTSCADNKPGLFDDSQKYSADKIGNSIFSSLESYFENDISKIKDIYLQSDDVYKNAKFFGAADANLMKSTISVALKNKGDRTAEDLEAIEATKAAASKYEGSMVAPDIFHEVVKLLVAAVTSSDADPHANNSFYKLANGDIRFKSKFGYEGDLSKNIRFRYDASPPNKEADDTTLQVILISEAQGPDKPPPIVLAEYSANRTPSVSLSPEDTLFNPEYGVTKLSTYYVEDVRKAASAFALQEDFYMDLLNSIFGDLLYSSLSLGLYKKEEFNKLQFTKNLSVAPPGCFLGFMNKRVLNKQMQKLAESLTCYAPNSATKGPVNVATIKIALDCIIRTIAVKEIMKSLFVYGIFPTELREDNERSLYDDFINKEIEGSIERALVRFFPGQNAFESFYNEVLKEFVTDVMRIIYQKDDLTDQESFNIIKDAQINFVKQQFKYVMPAGSISSKTTEYQLLDSVLNPEDEDNVDPFLSLTELSYTDRVQALQNDQLTLYLDSFRYSPNESINHPTKIIHSDADGFLSEPVIFRTPSREMEYFDLSLLESAKSADIGLILQANPNGMGLERLIEIKHNTSFLSDLPPETIQIFYKLLRLLGDKEMLNKLQNRRKLVGFLYETKLIMLFPQLHSIVQSMLTNAVDAPWRDYVDEDGSTNIFVTMYMMNYNPEEFLENNSEVYEKFINDSNLDWQYSGKYYLNDIENLISSFYYPNLDNPTTPQGDSEEFLSLSQDEFIDLYVPKSVKDFDSWHGLPLKKTWTIEFLKHISQAGNAIMPDILDNYIYGEKVVWGTPGQSFFEWLYKKSVKDILDINSVLRLAGYIKRTPNDPKFVDFASDIPPVIFKETMIKEKMGDIRFQHNNIDTGEPFEWTNSNNKYFCFPLFEAKHNIPSDISWCSFFGLFDRTGMIQENWYKKLFTSILEEDINKPGLLNEALFSPKHQKPCDEGDCPPLKDIYSFIYRFKAFTGLSVAEQQKKFVTKYQSTWWWNIRGVSVSKEQILEHIEAGGGHIPYAKDAAGNKHNFSTPGWDNNPYVYLAEASYASLTENGDYFFDEKGKRLSDGKYNAPTSLTNYPSPQHVKHDDGSALKSTAEVGLWVGDFKTQNPVTLEEVTLPKFIRTRPKYTNEAEKMHWIDLGWWSSTDKQQLIASFNSKYPGAEFDPAGPPYAESSETMHPIAIDADAGTLADNQKLDYKGLNPWDALPPGVGPDWFKDFATPAFSFGKVRGGITSAEAQEVELKLEGAPPLNAYIVFSKMLGPSTTISKDLFRKMLKSFFIKEQTTIISFIHKFMSEKLYPQLDEAFDTTLDACVDVLFAAIASANGDYQYTSKSNSTSQPVTPSLDFGMITGQLLKMFFGAMANTVDPTWKTQWFAPGPFTPFGVVAKLLDESGDMFKSSAAQSTSHKKGIPHFCADNFDEQTEFFDVKADETETETPE